MTHRNSNRIALSPRNKKISTLAHLSKKIDVSVFDKFDSSHLSGPCSSSQDGLEKDTRFAKMFGLNTLKSLKLKEDL